MTPEQRFSNRLCKSLPGHVQRVENVVGRGTPDLWHSFNGMRRWIETKCEENGRVLLRKEQYVWLLRERKQASIVMIIAEMKDKSIHCWLNAIDIDFTRMESGKLSLENPHRVYKNMKELIDECLCNTTNKA